MKKELRNRDSSLLFRALEVAKQSSCKQKHGVVIAVGKRILAIAVNTDRNDPNICSNPKTEASFHAEWNAIKQLLGADLSNAILYSARTNKDGLPMYAEPCLRCKDLMTIHGIKKVIHT